MAVPQLGTLTDANNARILDAIRNDSSSDYQNRIPAATQAGVDSVLKNLSEYRPAYNEFENALINRIGMVVGRSKSWTNPLAEFKKGILNWGDTIEEYQVGLLKAHEYDPDRDYMEKAIFARELPEVQANFHKVNRQNFYKVTVQEPLLRRAFLDDYGLQQYVSSIMDAPLTSDNWDEFLLTVSLFREYEAQGGFYKVNIPDIANLDSTSDEARLGLRKIRGMAETLRFISTKYNAAKMPTHAAPEDMVLFTTPEFRAALDVEALAGAFNIERAAVPNRIITIPEEHMNVPGAQAILTSKDFFIIADQRMENTSQFNPVSAGTNYFWHHWQVISASRFVPAVMFTTGAGDEVIKVTASISSIDSIDITDVDGNAVTDLERGMQYQCEATVTTNPEGYEDSVAVTWSILGHNSTRTHISQTGVLSISPMETSTSIKVVAQDSNENELVEVVNLTEDAGAVTGDAPYEWPVMGDEGEWVAGTAYEEGERIVLTGGEVLEATVAGESGTTEPTAPASVGGTVVDNEVTWKRIS